ncbi:MAG: hypothetical protein HY741_18385 [Chloroflexi bacterium]|nr:hypothetical protein [Chloroflexota bacterium]
MFTRNQSLLGLGALALALVLVLILGFRPLRAADPVCSGLLCQVLHTTTNDFVRGEFYATGLRQLGDGEVQLLPVGLSTPWQATTGLPAARAELALVSNNNILYAIGGYDGSSYHTEIYSATTSLVSDITSSWALADNLPVARAGAAAVIAHNPDPILYVIGGGTGSATNTIYYKKIAANGALSGAWSSATLPANRVYSGAVVRGTNLYVIGGGSSGSDTVYRLPIQNSNGDLGAAVEDLALPETLSAVGAVTWFDPAHDFVYVLGGQNFLGAATQNVYYTSFNADGSLNDNGGTGWLNTSLVDAFTAHGAVQYHGVIYVIGGKQGIGASTAITKVQTALIDPDGSLHNWGGGAGNWIVTEPLPQARFFHGSAANDGGELFIAGGYNASGIPQTNVYHGSTTGAASTYAPNGTYTGEPFDVGTNKHMTALNWNAAVEDTSNNNMALAMYYRTSNDSTALQSQPWTLAGLSVQSTDGFTNTLNFPTRLDQRYLQYRAIFTTTYSNKSPRLNAVELAFEQAPTPTPTRTDTPTVGASNTPTPTGSATATTTATATNTNTATATPTATATNTATNTPTSTAAITNTPTPSATPCSGKPKKVTLVSPNKNASLLVRAVPLAWNANPCATKFKVIGKYGNKKGIRAFKNAKATGATWTTKKLDKGKTVVWHVKACNAIGCGKWSDWWNFKVSKQAK